MTRSNLSNQQGEQWSEKQLHAFRDHLVPSSSFYAQTKASLFQKIAHDKQKRYAGRLFPNTLSKWIGVVTSAALLAGMIFSTSLFAPKVTLAYVGEFDVVQGEVFIHRADGTVRAQSKDKIFEGDTIEVSSASKAEITLAGEAQAELAENTQIHVDDVMTMRGANNVIVSSQVHLQLQKGTYSQKKTDVRTDSSTLITLATASGTIKASAYADYVVKAGDADHVALSVHSNGVTVLKEGEDIQLASGQIVREGESVMLSNNNEGGVVMIATTNPVTSTGSMIATTITQDTKTPPATRTTAKAPENKNDNENAILTLTPDIAAADISFRTTLDTLQGRLDIAQVKMEQAVNFYVKGESEQAAIAMSGYVTTMTDVYNAVANANQNAPSTRGGQASLDQIVAQSPLVNAYDDLTGMAGIDKTTADYRKTLQSLEELSRAEAALRMDIAAKTNGSSAPIAMSTSPATSNGNDNTNVDKISVRTYTKKVQGDIYSQVDAIVQDTDAKRRSGAFVQLLSRIPNESRNIPMLERIQSMVPENLRGFVEVKIHRIKYPEVTQN